VLDAQRHLLRRVGLPAEAVDLGPSGQPWEFAYKTPQSFRLYRAGSGATMHFDKVDDM